MVSAYFPVAIVGLALGSFVNALVWRLHEQEVLLASKTKKRLSSAQIKLKEDLSIVHGRSMCTHCHHQLAVKDLVPLFSWLSLRGTCRYCHKAIGAQYPLVECTTLILFVFSYAFWPSGFHGAGLLEFIVWLVLLVGFVALVVYDLRWMLLPNRIVTPLAGIVILQILIVTFCYHGGGQLVLRSLWGTLIGGGIFYVLFQISQGRWIGGGDVKLGALLGLVLGGPVDGILLLFSASLIGTVVALPLMGVHKIKHNSHVPFGPFLIFAAVIIRLFGASLTHWIKSRYSIT
jgi:prepilin signal peptidase PulO-like enzyme (type II secretory pathway)